MGCAAAHLERSISGNALKIGIYFVHFYHTWGAVDNLNHDTRRVLGFRTTFEVFFGKMARYTKPPLIVALRK